MPRVVDVTYEIALATALCATALGLGLSSDVAGLLRPFRNRRLLTRIVVLDVLLATVAAITVLVALMLAWTVGGPERESRVVVALVTGIRANAVAQSSFPSQPAVRAAVATFGVRSTVLPLAIACVLATRRRMPPVSVTPGLGPLRSADDDSVVDA